MPESGVVRAAIVQAKWTGDTASMIEVHENYAREAAQQGAKIMGFQEVFNAPVLLPGAGGRALPVGRAGARRPDGDADAGAGPRDRAWCSSCRSSRSSSAGNYYNTAAVIDADGTVLGKYRKHHIPQVKGFWEKYYFKPGNLGWPVFDTAVGTVGVYICYDRHFPEGWRALGLAGRADRVQPVGDQPRRCRRTCGSWSSRPRRWPTSTSSPRSTGSGVEEYGDNDFYGTSYFVDPRGQFVGDVALVDTTRSWSSATWTSSLIDEVRQQWAFYRDRRPDAYGPLVQQ